MKKIFFSAMVFALIIALSLPVSADKNDGITVFDDIKVSVHHPKTGGMGILTEKFTNKEISLCSDNQNVDFETYFYEKCKENTATIDVSAYNISTSDFKNIYLDIMLKYPELFICNSKASYTSKNNIISTISPTYLVSDKADKEKYLKLYEEKINEYYLLVKDEPDQLKKYLLIHDKMTMECRYDYSSSNSLPESYSCLGFFKNQLAVCQGYVAALKMICDKVGLEADYCVNWNILPAHIWNKIKINDVWYNTDVTWDDYNAQTESGQYVTYTDSGCIHTDFLCCDATFKNDGHGSIANWSCVNKPNIECTNTKYEDLSYAFNSPPDFNVLKTFMKRDNNIVYRQPLSQKPVYFISNELTYSPFYVSIPEFSDGNCYVYIKANEEKEHINLRSVYFINGKIKNIESVKYLKFESGKNYYVKLKTPADISNVKYDRMNIFAISDALCPYIRKADIKIN